MLIVCWIKDGSPFVLVATDRCTVNANKVKKAVVQQHKRRGGYHHYNIETHSKIAKCACESRNKAAAV